MATDSGMIGSIMIFAIVLILVAAVMFFAQRYKRCPPDQIMVIYGRTERTADGRPKPSKTLHGGAALVWPLIQDYAYISLKPMTIRIDLENALSQQNIRINVPSTFTIGVSTEPSIRSTASYRLDPHNRADKPRQGCVPRTNPEKRRCRDEEGRPVPDQREHCGHY